MHNGFSSYHKRGGTANDKKISSVVSIHEYDEVIELNVSRKEATESGTTFRTRGKRELSLKNLSQAQTLEIVKLLENWLNSESHPTLDIDIDDVEGVHTEDDPNEFGREQPSTETNFSGVNVSVNEQSVEFGYWDEKEEEWSDVSIPSADYIEEQVPQNFTNVTNLYDTLYDFFTIEYSGQIEYFEFNKLESSDFDEELVERAVSQYRDGHYQSAVRTAFIILEERVREMGGFSREVHGDDLMTEAFNPNGGKIVMGDTDGEQQGFMFLFRGAMLSLRNPASHRFVEEVDEGYARDALHTVNLLLRLLDLDQSGETNTNLRQVPETRSVSGEEQPQE